MPPKNSRDSDSVKNSFDEVLGCEGSSFENLLYALSQPCWISNASSSKGTGENNKSFIA